MLSRKKCFAFVVVILGIFLLLQFIPCTMTLGNMVKTKRFELRSYGMPLGYLHHYSVNDLKTNKEIHYESEISYFDALVDIVFIVIGIGLFQFLLRRKMKLVFKVPLIVCLLLSALLIMLLGWGISLGAYYNSVKEKYGDEFNKKALVFLADFVNDKEQVEKELKQAKELLNKYGCVTEYLVVTTDGEWLAYRQECGKNNPIIGDHLVGVTSDGRWVYTEYHICLDMFSFRMDGPHKNLDELLNHENYKLKVFSKKPDLSEMHGWKR